MISKSEEQTILGRLNVETIVNGYGPATILGGSVLDDRILKAMSEVSKQFVDMDQLLDRAGEHIARILGVESALVTSGAAAGLALSAAGCMTGVDRSKMEKLPDTSDFEKNEIVIQDGHRNTYDRCLRVSGAKLVPVGIPYLTYPWQLEKAITQKTAAVAHFTIGTARPGVLPLEQVATIAREKSVPIILDGCNEVLPSLSSVSSHLTNADLMVLSGGKNLQGPNDTGLICGKKELVDACRANAHPHMNGIGRTMKISKEQIVGLLVAVEIYATIDPRKRYEAWKAKLDYIENEVSMIKNIQTKTIPSGRSDLSHVPLLEISFDDSEFSPRDIVRALKGYDPPVVLDIDYWKNFTDHSLIVNPNCLKEGEEKIVASALKLVLGDRQKLKELLSKSKVEACAYP